MLNLPDGLPLPFIAGMQSLQFRRPEKRIPPIDMPKARGSLGNPLFALLFIAAGRLFQFLFRQSLPI